MPRTSKNEDHMAISGKVAASTVAASVSTVVAGIIAPHVFPAGTPSDIVGLFEAGVTAVVTFVSGYMARHGIAVPAAVEEAVALDFGVPFSSIPDAPEVLAPAEPVAPVAPVAPAPAVVAPVGEAQPLQ
jgi:hypothetical protein